MVLILASANVIWAELITNARAVGRVREMKCCQFVCPLMRTCSPGGYCGKSKLTESTSLCAVLKGRLKKVLYYLASWMAKWTSAAAESVSTYPIKIVHKTNASEPDN
jgi:hypothetical protein